MFFYNHEATYDMLLGFIGNTPPDGYTATLVPGKPCKIRSDSKGPESHIILDLGSLCTPPSVPEIHVRNDISYEDPKYFSDPPCLSREA